MRVHYVLALAAAVTIGAFTAPAHAAPISYGWTNQDITFTLDVEDFGNTVDALLTVDRTADANTDLLAGVSVKIFSSDMSSIGSLVSQKNLTDNVNLTDWVAVTGGVGGKDGLFDSTGLDGPFSSPSFYSAAYNAFGGEVTGKKYEFLFRWTPTAVSPLSGPSIKAITVTGLTEVVPGNGPDGGDTSDIKSRQWSSGELNPGTPNDNPPVPEPGTLVLVGLGAAGYVIARRRKRA